jgi:hypothetical protein
MGCGSQGTCYGGWEGGTLLSGRHEWLGVSVSAGGATTRTPARRGARFGGEETDADFDDGFVTALSPTTSTCSSTFTRLPSTLPPPPLITCDVVYCLNQALHARALCAPCSTPFALSLPFWLCPVSVLFLPFMLPCGVSRAVAASGTEGSSWDPSDYNRLVEVSVLVNMPAAGGVTPLMLAASVRELRGL